MVRQATAADLADGTLLRRIEAMMPPAGWEWAVWAYADGDMTAIPNLLAKKAHPDAP